MESASSIFITIGESDFYVQPRPKHRLNASYIFPYDASSSTREIVFRPATVLSWTTERFSQANLNAIIADLADDDVWNESFLAVLVFRTFKPLEVDLAGNPQFICTDCTKSVLPDGPYVIEASTGNIFAVFRLFEDRYQAFIGSALKPNESSNTFDWLNTENRIAVPSRKYSEHTSTKSLSGLRFAVKDIIDVAGLETGCGNRSYRNLYPKKTVTAPCIQQLIDAGAILVGKTMTTQFAEGQEPVQWFDYLAPLNPRGDTYQKPSSSSAGSAVASAAYPWIDFTVGTDTGGSIRHPAGVCGVYGMRPTLNSVSTHGVYSVSSILDTVGIFARSATVLEAASRALLNPSFSIPPEIPLQNKCKLLYLIHPKATKPEDSGRWFPRPNSPSNAEAASSAPLEKFVQELESHLGCSRTALDLHDLWRQTRPAGQSESLHEATSSIYTVLTTYDCVRHTIDPFISDHQAAHAGRRPFIDPIVQARHTHGRNLTPAQHAHALASAQIFKTWILSTLLPPTGPTTLLIFPQTRGLPDPRTTPIPPSAPLFFRSFSPYSLSYLSGCPDITVPVGDVPSVSPVTGVAEWLPVSASLLAPAGMEMRVLRSLAAMQEAGSLREVRAGRRAYG